MDSANNLYVYLIDGSVVRISSGGSLTTLVAPGGASTAAGGVCLDETNGHLYFTSFNTGGLSR